MVKRKFLISYTAKDSKGTCTGRFFNEREDDTLPSEENILSMEKKLEDFTGFDSVITTNI